MLERLARIEALRAAGAEPHALLVELRALVGEGEAWVAAEGRPAGRAGEAVADLGVALDLARHEGREGEVIGESGGRDTLAARTTV